MSYNVCILILIVEFQITTFLGKFLCRMTAEHGAPDWLVLQCGAATTSQLQQYCSNYDLSVAAIEKSMSFV